MTRPALLDIVSSFEDPFSGILDPTRAGTWQRWRRFESAYETGTTEEIVAAAQAYTDRQPEDLAQTSCVLGAFLLARGEADQALQAFGNALQHVLGRGDYIPTAINAFLGYAAVHLMRGNSRAALVDAAAAAELFFGAPDFYVGDANPFGGPGWSAQMATFPMAATLEALTTSEIGATSTLRGRLLYMHFLAGGGNDRSIFEAARALLGHDPVLREWEESCEL